MNTRLDQQRMLDLAYARFNAMRTLGDERPSAFRLERIGALDVTVDPARQSSYSNRVVGLTAASLRDLDAALARLPDTSVRVEVEAEAETRGVLAALSERGFEKSVDLLWLDGDPSKLAAEPVLPSGARIERWQHDRAGEYLDLLARSGVEIPEQVRDLRRQHYVTDTFRTFVATMDGTPVAWSTLFVHGALGLLGNAMTLEGHERQGLHLSLLHARLRDAANLGLSWLASDVLPNTTSQRNCERAGLRPLVTLGLYERG